MSSSKKPPGKGGTLGNQHRLQPLISTSVAAAPTSSRRAGVKSIKTNSGAISTGAHSRKATNVDYFARLHLNPYSLDQTKALISVVFGFNKTSTDDSIIHAIPDDVLKILTESPAHCFPSKDTFYVGPEKEKVKQLADVHYNLMVSLIHTTCGVSGWEIFDAYSARMAQGVGGSYNGKSDSWSKTCALEGPKHATAIARTITIPGSIAAQVCVAAFGKEAVKSSFDFNSKMDALNFERDILDDVKLYWKSCHSKFITGVLEAKVRSASTALTNAKDTFNKMSNELASRSQVSGFGRRRMPTAERTIKIKNLNEQLHNWEANLRIVNPNGPKDVELTDAKADVRALIADTRKQVRAESPIVGEKRSDEVAREESQSQEAERELEEQEAEVGKDDEEEAEGGIESVTGLFDRHRPSGAVDQDETEDVQIGVEAFRSWSRRDQFAYLGYQPESIPNVHSPSGTGELLRFRDLQLVGVGGICSRAHYPSHPAATFVCDETSMGKTLQAGLAIHTFAYWGEKAALQSRVIQAGDDPDPQAFPPYARVTPANVNTMAKSSAIDQAIASVQSSTTLKLHNFGSTNSPIPPALPSIIIGPAVTMDAMSRELKAVFPKLIIHQIKARRDRDGAYQTITFDQKYWKENVQKGRLGSGARYPGRHLVLASYNQVASIWKERDTAIKAARKHGRTYRGGSLMDLEYCVSICDEAHYLKEPNGNFTQTTLAMCAQAKYRIIQTATPILKNPLDIGVLGAVAAVRESRGILAGVGFSAKYRAARDVVKAQEKADKKANWISSRDWFRGVRADGTAVQGYKAKGILSPSLAAEVQRGQPGLTTTVFGFTQVVTAFLGDFLKYVIRRTRSSLDKAGQPALQLGQISELLIPIILPHRESEVVRLCLRDRNAERKKKLEVGSLGWFGAGYGAAIDSTIHPYYSLYKRLPKQGEPFHDKISTKLQKAMELIQTIMEEEKDLRTEQKSKFIFHVDHIASVEPLLQALATINQSAAIFTGESSQKEREDLFRTVNRDQDHPATRHPNWPNAPRTCRVLICTPVAGLGITLWRMNVVINLSVPWSHAAYQQRIGRSHRSPPAGSKKTPLKVQVFTIVALNSVDMAVWAAACFKASLENALFQNDDLGLTKVDYTEVGFSDPSSKFGKYFKTRVDDLKAAFTRGQRRILRDNGAEYLLEHLRYCSQSIYTFLRLKRKPPATVENTSLPTRTLEELEWLESGDEQANLRIDRAFLKDARLKTLAQIQAESAALFKKHSENLENSIVKRLKTIYAQIDQLLRKVPTSRYPTNTVRENEHFRGYVEDLADVAREHRKLVQSNRIPNGFSVPSTTQGVWEWYISARSSNGDVRNLKLVQLPRDHLGALAGGVVTRTGAFPILNFTKSSAQLQPRSKSPVVMSRMVQRFPPSSRSSLDPVRNSTPVTNKQTSAISKGKGKARTPPPRSLVSVSSENDNHDGFDPSEMHQAILESRRTADQPLASTSRAPQPTVSSHQQVQASSSRLPPTSTSRQPAHAMGLQRRSAAAPNSRNAPVLKRMADDTRSSKSISKRPRFSSPDPKPKKIITYKSRSKPFVTGFSRPSRQQDSLEEVIGEFSSQEADKKAKARVKGKKLQVAEEPIELSSD